jgi:subtilisin family serine protease
VLLLGRGFGQTGPRAGNSPSLLTFDGIQHALLGDAAGPKKLSDRESNLQLRHEIGEGNSGNTVRDKQVVYASVRDIPPRDEAGRPNYVPGQLVVRFHGGVPHRRQDQIVDELGARILRTLDARRGEYLVVLSGISVPAAAEQFAKLQEVDFAEPNVLHYINHMPNDQLYAAFDNQPTELQRWCFNGMGADSNLNAEAAWAITTGSSNVVIAVIDTGVAIRHPDLAANIWTNPYRAEDEANGYTNAVHGWDFYNNDNDPTPDLGDGGGDGNVFHGTFVAGVAAAVSNNRIGVVGASWHSKIMPLKVFTNSGGAPSSAINEAIHYAVDHGADIINMSFGSPVATRSIYSAVQYAAVRGVIMISAAGNDNSSHRSYPASYPYVVSVGGTGSGSVLSGGSVTNMRARASFSQYGPRAVDVVAPAVDIVSTAVLSVTDEQNGWGRAGTYTYFYGNGTSFSSPLVAGEAALLLAREEQLGLSGSISLNAIEKVIVSATTSLDPDPVGGANWAGHGRVDFSAAVQQIGPQLVTPPAAPVKIKVKATGPGDVELDWTDRSDNEEGFVIERAEKTNGVVSSFEPIAQVNRNVTSYVDDTTEADVTYEYRVEAFNVAATNSVRRAVKVTTP